MSVLCSPEKFVSMPSMERMRMRPPPMLSATMSSVRPLASSSCRRTLDRAKLLEETQIKNVPRYRVRSLPAAGALLRPEDREEGIRASAAQTLFRKGVPCGATGTEKLSRFFEKYSESCAAASAVMSFGVSGPRCSARITSLSAVPSAHSKSRPSGVSTYCVNIF